MPVGDLTVTYIPDGTVQISPSLLLPDSDPAFWASNAHLLDEQGYLVIGAGGLLVRGTDWALLIDTGLGPAPTAPALDGLGPISGGALLRSLSQVGVSPSDLSGVAITHLHADHIGWWSDGPLVATRAGCARRFRAPRRRRSNDRPRCVGATDAGPHPGTHRLRH